MKNPFCLTRGTHAILSQHIGDLENYETMCFFEETLAKMKRLFRVEPQAIAYDLHPGYRSTRMALASGIERRIAVQHHHAHIASCMAENHLGGKVIGVAMHGTGLGSDGTIWGEKSWWRTLAVSSGTPSCGLFPCRAATRLCASLGGWRLVICAMLERAFRMTLRAFGA